MLAMASGRKRAALNVGMMTEIKGLSLACSGMAGSRYFRDFRDICNKRVLCVAKFKRHAAIPRCRETRIAREAPMPARAEVESKHRNSAQAIREKRQGRLPRFRQLVDCRGSDGQQTQRLR